MVSNETGSDASHEELNVARALLIHVGTTGFFPPVERFRATNKALRKAMDRMESSGALRHYTVDSVKLYIWGSSLLHLLPDESFARDELQRAARLLALLQKSYEAEPQQEYRVEALATSLQNSWEEPWPEKKQVYRAVMLLNEFDIYASSVLPGSFRLAERVLDVSGSLILEPQADEGASIGEPAQPRPAHYDNSRAMAKRSQQRPSAPVLTAEQGFIALAN